MIDTVMSLMNEGFCYISEEKARRLYVRSECKKIEEEIAFLDTLGRLGKNMSLEYHVALQRYFAELPNVKWFILKHGTTDERAVIDERIEQLHEVYQHYFYKTMRLFAVN